MMRIIEIQEEVRKLLLNRFSGGSKFLTLLADLVEAELNQSFGSESDFDSEIFTKRVELAIENMKDVGILEYGWPMGNGVVRNKLFIYLKI